MNIQTPRKTQKTINKIKRFSPIIFLKKYKYIFITIIVITLSILLGFWNVRKVEYQNEDLKYSSQENIEKGIEYLKGTNIFRINPEEIETQLRIDNPFLKEVELEKVVPSKLVLKIYEYTPKYIYYTQDNCNIYSNLSNKITSICENCSEECKGYTTEYETIYVASDNSLDNNETFMYTTELNNITRLLYEFGYDISEVNIKDELLVLTDGEKTFMFDLNQDLNTQLSRLYLVGEKINEDQIEFVSLDLRFERPILKTK